MLFVATAALLLACMIELVHVGVQKLEQRLDYKVKALLASGSKAWIKFSEDTCYYLPALFPARLEYSKYFFLAFSDIY